MLEDKPAWGWDRLESGSSGTGFSSILMSSAMEQEQPQFFYKNMNELVAEWQESNKDCSLWEYIGISEPMFRTWIAKCKRGVFEN